MSDTGMYPNRSDLRGAGQKVTKQVVPGQTYGKGAEQMRAQQAVPMGRSPVEAPVPQRPMPGSLGSFSRPTERPLEPITAGADFGPGPNSVMAGIPMLRSDVSSAVQELRSIAMQYGTDDLLDLLDVYGDEI